jgi:uncharacterized RmlC-like cupin family protein
MRTASRRPDSPIITVGVHAEPHRHCGYETGTYVLAGRVETRYGPVLRQSVITEGPTPHALHLPDCPDLRGHLSTPGCSSFDYAVRIICG